jgi:hypothetical protein
MSKPKTSSIPNPVVSTEQEALRAFIDTGLLWFINRTLHVFGYALCYKEDEETGVLSSLYVSRVTYRGFEMEAEDDGYERVARYLRDQSTALYDEAAYHTVE